VLHPKKVGALPVAGTTEELKQTNEIKMAIPLLDGVVDLAHKDVTADALLTQRSLATYLVKERKAHYHFTVKGNQPTLFADLTLFFKDRGAPHFIESTPAKLGHGRAETRRIWVTSELNDYLNFPHVGQAFAIERETMNRTTGKRSQELVYGITSRGQAEADAQRLLAVNRGHWSIENSCHYVLDWNYDEDRSRIRTGYGPENVTRLRRFAISVIYAVRNAVRKPRTASSVAQKMRELATNSRLVFDYLRMTENSRASVRR
jgi:predicted transposase YbfD/YdcC